MSVYFDEHEPIYRETSPLSIVETRLAPEIDDEQYLPPVSVVPKNDPGLRVLLPALQSGDSFGGFDRAMSDSAMSGLVDGGNGATAISADQLKLDNIGPSLLEATAAAAVQASDRDAHLPSDPKEPERVDSAQDGQGDPSMPPSDPKSRASLHIDPLPMREPSASAPRDSMANSPTLSKHMQSTDQGTVDTLPAVQVSPRREVPPMLPQAPSLPSIRHLTDLAEAAMQQDPRASHQHSHPINPAMTQQPGPQFLPPNFHAASSHTTPSGYQSSYSRSPTSTIGGDMQQYPSPHAQFSGSSYFQGRRRSTSINSKPPPFLTAMHSMPSVSSSGESHGHPHSSTSTDGYSTSHTTPIDHAGPGEALPRPILPPPHGMTMATYDMYRCDHPGCNAAPFQTQYLLTSHRNVHSQVRAHYCPVKGCPRSEGGKGFKRKNEMIRHGLVHSSPGYICPYCPDREHRYPRPDNLQRHVRVHHEDKDKDDPVLREVLAQRLEGEGKQRRRRTQGSISSLHNETSNESTTSAGMMER
ncbi:unnamed protein product [Zymoseptoria tritici ST99CH_3D1]|nr:unnamed protein product [Zymoseptoria tritici ST99CH_3D1]